MTVCIRCHRPLKWPSPTGMGPVCASRAAKPVPAHEPDLWGYDIAKGEEAARYRLQVLIEGLAAEAHVAVRHQAAAARRRLGVWS